ncbi:DEAD/DEAH box helicase family protein [Sphingorhabdus sp.]|jgi:superfamily II DNA or RNA helicase|uniref:DEAD/DEAH box helicase family protein n=1 Tax=Sphingorhabdus sp. TaxID=1902408 RepID=UPI0037C8A6DF
MEMEDSPIMPLSPGRSQLSQRIMELLSHYRSGSSTLGVEFFGPCLKEAVRYRRAAGYFSSSALITWAGALPGIVRDRGLKVQLIASPELSQADVLTLRKLGDETERQIYRQKLSDDVLDQIIKYTEDTSDVSIRAEIFAWMIANDRLEIKFAFPTHVQGADLFHAKYGVFDFQTGERVAFTGSANETFRGHTQNYEAIDVYRDWVAGDAERVDDKAAQFDEAWENRAQGLNVLAPSENILKKLRARAPSEKPEIQEPVSQEAVVTDPRWKHQEEAVAAFLEKRAGILEMATGTGKTRTSIKILDNLINSAKIDRAIVTTDGTDLLEQWSLELGDWALEPSRLDWVIYRHFGKHHELADYSRKVHPSVLVISRTQLERVLKQIPPHDRTRTLIIHDEVHGLGQPALVASLQGEHSSFGWKLGLSATPERAYDDGGNAFITSELGPTIFEFPLERAIARGVLCEFDYIPLGYELTQNDRDRLRDVQRKKAARQHAGNPMSKEEIWIEYSKVYKTAEAKPDVFHEYLKSNPDILKNCIIFVETIEYGKRVLEIIDRYTHRYRTYYADDDRADLVRFARGEFDCLITCHRISQGIDIQALENVVLFASASAKLETIQRIGRCLRLDPSRPEKRARVVDFVRPSKDGGGIPDADQERCTWLDNLSTIRKGDDV